MIANTVVLYWLLVIKFCLQSLDFGFLVFDSISKINEVMCQLIQKAESVQKSESVQDHLSIDSSIDNQSKPITIDDDVNNPKTVPSYRCNGQFFPQSVFPPGKEWAGPFFPRGKTDRSVFSPRGKIWLVSFFPTQSVFPPMLFFRKRLENDICVIV